MSAEELLRDHFIPHSTTHHHVTEGWVGVRDCPFCGSRNYHLGISNDLTQANCWRCGGHRVETVVAKLLGVSNSRAASIILRYRDQRRALATVERPTPIVTIRPFRFPPGTGRLDERGRRYLKGRRFDPEKLEHEWGLKQTPPVSLLDGTDYGNRLIIPVSWGGRVVSWQSRDLTGKHLLRYLSCPKARERIHLKHILYGKPETAGRFRKLFVVEGPADVWRLGPCAVATFGIAFTREQVVELSRLHEKFVICFDNEPHAQRQAQKLARLLRVLGKQADVITVETDPADLLDKDFEKLYNTKK